MILSKPKVWILIGFRGVAVVGQWLVMGGNLFFQISLDIEDGSGEGDIYNLILELRDIITIWSLLFINCFILFSYYHYYTSSPFLTFGSTSLLIKKNFQNWIFSEETKTHKKRQKLFFKCFFYHFQKRETKSKTIFGKIIPHRFLKWY